MPGGRPSKLNPERKERLLRALRTGAHAETACRVAGIGYSTFAEWMQRGKGIHKRGGGKEYTEFAEAVTQAIAEAEMALTARVRNATAEDWRAASWMLERRHPERWANTHRVQLEVDKQLEEQFDRFFEEVMGDRSIPDDVKQKIIDHARNLAERSEVGEL